MQEKSMKPMQVGILVAVAAVAGGLITKWATSRSVAPVSTTATAAAPAPATPAAPVTPAAAQAPEALPSPIPEEKPPAKEPARKARTWHRAEPKVVAQRVVAQNLPPVTPAPEPAPQAEPTPRTQPAAPEPAQAVQVPELPAPAPPPLAPPPAPRQVTLTSGTLIPARTVEGLSSDRNQAGDGFTATLDAPLVVDGLVIAERGAHLEGKVVQSDKAGRVKGVSDLAIELTQITTSDGQRVPIETESVIKHGQTSKGADAAKVGGGAALGAIIGAIAGGGKGAAIGTAVGGAAGAGTVAATRGKAVAIAAETRISFVLKNTVTITERQGNR
jgi:hypothetical protein